MFSVRLTFRSFVGNFVGNFVDKPLNYWAESLRCLLLSSHENLRRLDEVPDEVPDEGQQWLTSLNTY